jgi:DNA polymerase-1
MFLNMVAGDAAGLKASHVLVCFDWGRSFRHDLYKAYKANRLKGEPKTYTTDAGTEYTTEITPGALVKPAINVCKLAGLATARHKLYEADDLLGSAAVSISGKVILGTRDKDNAGDVNERVRQYWPQDKKLLGPKEVLAYYGVHPHQIPDYLTLLGDTVDNIPGIPGCGPKTACAILAKYGTLDAAIKDPAFRKKYAAHKSTLAMARKLVTLRRDIKFNLADLVPQKIDTDLGNLVWSIPNSLRDLADSRKAMSMKGLFS